ncbi:MAG: DUF4062 domain-containing protein [Deltaproteobacteria bacterium]|nr:DUF4062 domain-containing protein [Deltaproteobacteria bacterium]
MSVRVFISSTVADLGSVRSQLADLLRRDGSIEILRSETDEFPVEPGVTSHEACLREIRNCHAFILLVGSRFGGEYDSSNKSITWREWEEARLCGLTPVVLVKAETNRICQEIAKRRRELARAKPRVPDIEKVLDAEFKSQGSRMAGVQRFVDALRKGHVDNWFHEWDGQATSAFDVVVSRLSTQFAAFQRAFLDRREATIARQAQLESLRWLTANGTRAVAAVFKLAPKQRMSAASRALDWMFDAAVQHRGPLFGFRESDIYTLTLRKWDGRELVPLVRKTNGPQSAPPSWKRRQSLAGQAFAAREVLVSGDIRQTDAWVERAGAEADREVFVSSTCVPVYRAGERKPWGTLAVTSGRLDHFHSLDQPEVLTIRTLAEILSLLI